MNIAIRRVGVWLLASSGLAQLGCGAASHSQAAEDSIHPQPEPPVELFEGKSVRAEHSAPVVGGTLLVTRDGRTIAAADPDRDALFLVDAASHLVTKVSFPRGDEPGRLAEGADGTLFVALRRAGAVVAIDVARGAVVHRQAVCASPRGIAYDSEKSSLYVACRSGQLLTLDAQSLSRTRTLQLDPDLRDVIVRERDLVVTRFMSAEVMVVADDGSVARRATPQTGCGAATVAYRALSLPNGQVALAHQISSNDPVMEGPGGYGAGNSCGGSLVTRVVSTIDPETPADTASISTGPAQAPPPAFGEAGAPGLGEAGAPGLGEAPGAVVHSSMTIQSSMLPGAGPLDVAFDAPGTRIAVIALDGKLTDFANQVSISPGLGPVDLGATLWVTAWDRTNPVFGMVEPVHSYRLAGQPVAVAFSGTGAFIVQSREPATLEFEGGTSVKLSDESHADTGHLMFNMNSGIGIACASCHPEGGDDGHVWRFPEGLRRTMPLEGGVMERAPFHWDGTLGDMNTLVNAVMVTRMALPQTPSATQIGALAAFLEQLPNLPPADGLDAAAVARGAAVFRREDVACASCHSGPQYTNNQIVDVGTGGVFATPTLLGVGLRPALFHDGCAKSLDQRFGVCGGTAHGKPELLSADERADMIAFLRSL